MFNIGDRVEYFKGTSTCNQPFIGKTGVVTRVGSYGQLAILWDHPTTQNENGGSENPCWSIHNFKPLIFKYDPKQAGDQDDDI